MTKLTIHTAQMNIGNKQINTEIMKIRQSEIKDTSKGDESKCCINPIFPLGCPEPCQLQHRVTSVYVSLCQTQYLPYELWKNSRIILTISCDSYALLQTDSHSGACAGPDVVSCQLREASLCFVWRSKRGIRSGIPTYGSVPYSCSKQWYP